MGFWWPPPKLEQFVPAPESLRSKLLGLKTGQRIDQQTLLDDLIKNGYEAVTKVAHPGQVARRGGILDIHAWNCPAPVRLEFFGDEIESIRSFDPDTQVSQTKLSSVSLALVSFDGEEQSATLADYLPARTMVIIDDMETLGLLPAQIARFPRMFLTAHPFLPDTTCESGFAPVDSAEGFHFHDNDFLLDTGADEFLLEKRRETFIRTLSGWLADDWEVIIFGNNSGELQRLGEILDESGIRPAPGKLRAQIAPVTHGFSCPSARLAVLTDAEIFGRYQNVRRMRRLERLRQLRGQTSALDFSELAEGDYVVHLSHGIGIYGGLVKTGELGQEKETICIIFAGSAKLFVPLDQAYLVTKYTGVGKRHPKLDTLGGARWEKARIAAQRSVLDYAAKLLKVQAERQTLQGHSFGPDTKWQREFEDSFLYEETPDQERAIIESKRDMESARPMDRLVCGDVGFGKTEVAIRAVFKCAMDGRQSVLLAPTTVLSEQHYRTLKERFADYPIRIEALNRFKKPSEQRQIIEDTRGGQVDVLVGTHRILSQDVDFKKLGLVVIDEEQRFGVRQKEKFKDRFRLVDMLTLSATPIPRTLYLSLAGVKDMSLIETPPTNRQSVETYVGAYDERIIRKAIERELARGGQVYFLHNRIDNILHVRDRIKELCPAARVDVGHGQMHEEELETVMKHFIEGKTDVLVSTTIIESGIDIPNANTIIIDRADRFGLADLYQLRGRVGRSATKAHAYLLLPRHLMLQADARKRVGSIKQYSQLGSGFKIAMRDLEIRGSGNLLGTEQSGHIAAIGFDLYCHLLKTTVAQLRGEAPPLRQDVPIRIDFMVTEEDESAAAYSDKFAFNAWIPRKYVEDTAERVTLYRRFAEALNGQDVNNLLAEIRDRYGKCPSEVRNLGLLTELKILCAERRLSELLVKEGKIIAKRAGDFLMDGNKFPRLTADRTPDRIREIIDFIDSSKK
ncbi:transcription-repair coupling factor [Geitlerinema calcuttense]|uniref:Transcription-repair-coupling factor n=1 Tax=Geitlerinema calcuttense NRMC-F 0142 TaxID=2922238 RepID=A0ABT7M078_9CYAN|nr:transcription-repair coupling factor [Geitlerinema calcuttense]MDL5057464.1 transcription-repair coupling factor [Geitlerinema calcuttense NRMC-F 0142]